MDKKTEDAFTTVRYAIDAAVSAHGLTATQQEELFKAVRSDADVRRHELRDKQPDCETCDGAGWVEDEEDGGTKACPDECDDGKVYG